MNQGTRGCAIAVGVAAYLCAVALFASLVIWQFQYWDSGGDWECSTPASCSIVAEPLIPAWLLGVWGLLLLALPVLVVVRRYLGLGGDVEKSAGSSRSA